MLRKEKVISCQEMVRLEKKAFSQGYTDLAFMEAAGLAMANACRRLYSTQHKILLLCGKGNNAGDTYVIGRHLLSAGYSVFAREVFPSQTELSPLCQKQRQLWLNGGGRFTDDPFSSFDLILDGIFGTGFTGEAREPVASQILEANASGVPIIAIDIPSGLNGDTGEGKVAIVATHTFYLGFAKKGFFTPQGWERVGILEGVDFGLPKELVKEASPSGWTVTEVTLPTYRRTQHKYERGATVGLVGSFTMPGAACISSLAALRSGAGMVLVKLAPSFAPMHQMLPWEVVRLPMEAPYKAHSRFAGCGLGKAPETIPLLKAFIEADSLPLILDADGLNLLDLSWKRPPMTILTPHLGELRHLLKKPNQEPISDEECQAFADQHHLILVRKGAPTVTFVPHQQPLFNSTGDPCMATAGSGDVLSGMIAALLAQGILPEEAAVTAVFLHGLAGERAAHRIGKRSVIASDLIEQLGFLFSHEKVVATAVRSVSKKTPLHTRDSAAAS